MRRWEQHENEAITHRHCNCSGGLCVMRDDGGLRKPKRGQRYKRARREQQRGSSHHNNSHGDVPLNVLSRPGNRRRQAKLQEQGYSDITANEDGSYTVTMSIDKYNDLVDSMHDTVANQLDGMPNSENWQTITAIQYDDQFSNVTLTTSSSQVGLREAFAPLQAGIISCMYQQIAGQPVKCTVSIVDESGAELSSSVYPDVLDSEQKDAVVAN